MAIRFVVQARAIVRRAEKEAAEAGSPLVEAEHMLLAMTGEHGIEAREVLTSAGLDRDAIRAALDREFRHSLAAGVDQGDLAARTRQALERSQP
jgi:ATP-dependent Clp protease ATP-binding subunit ClpA